MSLNKELKIQTLVLLAKTPNEFIPANFNQYWLDIHKIVSADSISKDSFFSPAGVQVSSEKMNFVIRPDQIQISANAPFFKDATINNSAAMIRNMETIELNAMGLNFNWFISSVQESEIGDFCKKYFYNDNNPATAFFNNGDPYFGNYMSKDVTNGVRLKLDIKPAMLYDSNLKSMQTTIQFGFNFHCELKANDQKQEVLDILSRYDEWYDMTEKIMNLF